MTTRDFAYWLNGFFELQRADAPNTPLVITTPQAEMIQRHLNLVFEHDIDPSIDGKDPALKAKLDAIHNGGLSISPAVVAPQFKPPMVGLYPPPADAVMRPRC